MADDTKTYLGAVADNAAVLLGRSGQETRHVDKGQERDVEGVAEPNEPSGLTRIEPGNHQTQRARDNYLLLILLSG